jgi:GNAT superfamily N-acetyltransferase
VVSPYCTEGVDVLRAPVVVRVATDDVVASLSPLWAEFREQSGAGVVPQGTLDVSERVRTRIRESEVAVEAGLRPSYRLIVAWLDHEPIAFASLSVLERGLLTTSCAVLVDLVHVDGRHRKLGVGTTLLREAAVFADEIGASDVVVNVPPNVRDVNRFYARHGFAPMVVRRSAPIAVLRRKLGVEPRLDPRDVTVDLTPVQRSLRRRALLSPRRAVRS